MVYLGRPYHFKFFRGCLPQIVLGPFLNSLTHFYFSIFRFDSFRTNVAILGSAEIFTSKNREENHVL